MGSPYSVPGGVPFVPGVYDSGPGTARIADLILRQGDIQANRQARSGEIWGGAVNQVGQIAADAVKQAGQRREQRQIGEAVSAATGPNYPSATQPGPVGSGAPIDPGSYQGPPGMTADTSGRVPDPGASHVQDILNRLPGELRPAAMKGIQDFNAAADVAEERQARLAQMQQATKQANVDAMGTLAHHIVKNHFLDGPDGGLGAIGTAVTIAKQRGMSWASSWDTELQQATQAMQQAQQSGDPGKVSAVADTVRQHFAPALQQLEMSMSEDAQNRIKKNEAPITLKEGDKLLDPTTFATIAENAKEPSWQLKDTTKGIQPWNPKDPNQLGPVIGQPKPAASTIINPAALNDVKEHVAGMMDGTLPPLLPGRATKEFEAVNAEAHRQHFDLAAANTDWLATQKHISAMNSGSQLKLNQSINALPEMLDKVDALAAQWKGGRFPLLNKGNLAAAQAGAYGSDVAAVAKQLSAQIADVTADLGNVYMGGNSPTDHALDLAAKSLSADWDEKVLHKMTDLARSNVQIRQNSIRNTGVAGASAGNTYGSQSGGAQIAPAAPAAPAVSAAPVQIKGDADYNALPSGAMFIGPDGKLRKKP